MQADFSRKLSLLRKEAGRSQREAASALGVSQALMSHYETGAREPGIDFIVRSARYYGVTTDYLLGCSGSRSGEVISAADIACASDEKSRLAPGSSAAALLGKKLIVNSVSVIFDILGKSGGKKLVGEATMFFSLAVYKLFRHIYQKSGENDRNFFPGSPLVTSLKAEAGLNRCEAEIARILSDRHETFDVGVISESVIKQEYPAYAQSLLTVLHQAEERVG